MIDFHLLTGLILSTLIAYLFGALPIAVWVSRRRNVDIFSVGTGLPGASNVRRQVGNVPGGQVLIGDMAKGAIAILAARQMQIEGLWLALPCLAMVAGHWKSVFAGLKGGDGLAPLGGAILVMFPPFTGFIAVLIASVVSLGGQKLPYTSLLGLIGGIAALLWMTRSGGSTEEFALAGAVGFIAALVLLRAALGHRRRNSDDDPLGLDDFDDLDDGEECAPNSLPPHARR